MRGHHGYYRYSRQTTPNLSKRSDFLFFDDVISAWGSTTNSLRLTLTMSTLDDIHNSRCSLVDVFRTAGYRVSLFSNQRRWGVWDGPVAILFSHADSVLYMQERDVGAFDDVLEEPVRNELERYQGKSQVIFVHLMGSHTDCAQRYPEHFGPFNGLKDSVNRAVDESTALKINEYDNSIAFTDVLLGKFADEIANLPNPAFLLYFSDHGSIIDNGSDTLRSSQSKEPEVYEVPFAVQFNDAYRKTFPDTVAAAEKNLHRPMQLDRAFFGMAALANLCGTSETDRENIFSGSYVPPEKRTVSEGKILYQR